MYKYYILVYFKNYHRKIFKFNLFSIFRHSGWHITWTNCYCFPQKNNIEKKIKNGKIKRTPLGEQNNDAHNFDNNFYINADNLSVCIDLHILLENLNKIRNDLPSSDFKKDPEYIDVDEIHRAIAKNCDQISTIIQNSITEIKSNLKPERKINKLDDNKEPQTARSIVSHQTPSDYRNPTIAVDSTYEAINYSNFITTTEYMELIKDNSKELNLSEENTIQKGSTVGSPSLSNKESNITFKKSDKNKTQLTKTEHTKNSTNVKISTEATTNKSIISSNYLATGKEGSQAVNFKNTSILNNIPQRQKYDESRSYIIKLITQELSNGTVLSFINGTEILSRNDIDDITLQTEVSPKNNAAKSTPYDFEEQNLFDVPLTSITNRLYIIYEEKRIP